jgi:acyl carrier protein
MNTEVVTMVNKIIHEKFEVPMEKLSPSANLRSDLNLDSLDFVDMVVLLEQKVKLSNQEIDFLGIQTLNDVYVLVEKVAGQQNPL